MFHSKPSENRHPPRQILQINSKSKEVPENLIKNAVG
jgi:hypothetical protein